MYEALMRFVDRSLLVLVLLKALNALVVFFPMRATHYAAGSRALFLMNAFVYGLLLLRLATDPGTLFHAIARLRWLVVLILLPSVWALWSRDPWFFFRRSVWIVIASLGAIYFGRRLSLAEQVKGIWTAAMIGVIGSLLYAVADPRAAFAGGHFRGLFQYKNSFGVVVGLALLSSLHMPLRHLNAVLRWLYLPAGLALLTAIDSRTPLVAFLVAALAVPGIAAVRRVSRVPLLALMLVFIVVAPASWVLHVYLTDTASALGRETSLTGRRELWSFLLTEFWRNPIRGGGLDWWVNQEQQLPLRGIGWSPGQSHNGYIEVLLLFGVTGAVFLFGACAASFRRAWRWLASSHPIAAWPLSLLIFTGIEAVGEAIFVRENITWLAMVMTSSALASRRLCGGALERAHTEPGIAARDVCQSVPFQTPRDSAFGT